MAVSQFTITLFPLNKKMDTERCPFFYSFMKKIPQFTTNLQFSPLQSCRRDLRIAEVDFEGGRVQIEAFDRLLEGSIRWLDGAVLVAVRA